MIKPKIPLFFYFLLIQVFILNISFGQADTDLPAGVIKQFSQGASVYTVAFSPDGSLLASGGDNNQVILWDITNRRERTVFRGHSRSVFSVVFSPNGQMLGSASHDGYVRLWNVFSKRRLSSFFHGEGVNSVAFSPDGKTLASGGGDQKGSIKLWSITDNNHIANLPGHNRIVESVVFSPNGQMFASTSRDRTVKLWDITRQQVHKNLTKHKNVVYDVAFSPDSETFASSSNDYTIKIWKSLSGEIVSDFRIAGGINVRALAIAYSPDGKYLALACTDHTVRIRNIVERNEKILRGHSGVVTSVVFSPDGKTLASGSQDRTVLLWDLSYFKIVPDDSNPISEPIVDITPPTIDILSPSLQVVPQDTEQIRIRGEVSDDYGIGVVKVDGNEVWIGTDGIFKETILLSGGKNYIRVTATDMNNNIGTKRFVVERPAPIDTIPPIITLDESYNNQQLENNPEFTLSGSVRDNSRIGKVTVNDELLPLLEDGKFAVNVQLKKGDNDFSLTATDVEGNMDTKWFTIDYIPNPPPTIDYLLPGESKQRGFKPIIPKIETKEDSVEIIVEDEDGISKCTVNGENVAVRGTFFKKSIPLDYGDNSIHVTATDSLDSPSEKTFPIYRKLPIRKDYALLFAVDNYEYWPDLRYPISDAEKIQRDLEKIYGFQTELIRNPTRKEVFEAIYKYSEMNYDNGDQLFIFFAGHGHFNASSRGGYLVASDTELPTNDSVMLSYISHSRIRDDIDRMSCKHIFLVMDTCYSGTFDRLIAMRGTVEDISEPELSEKDIERIFEYTTRWYLTSGQKEQVPDVSKFMFKFLQALRSKGGDDSILTIKEILGYMKQLDRPKPHASNFGEGEPGSDFLFISK